MFRFYEEFRAYSETFLILNLKKYKRADRFSIKNENIKIPLYLKEIIPYISELRCEQSINIRYYANFRTCNFTLTERVRKFISIRMEFYGPYYPYYPYELSRYIGIDIDLAPLLLYAYREYYTSGYIFTYYSSKLDTFLEKKKHPLHIF